MTVTKTSKRIAIPYGCNKLNYGSMLQAYALKEYIQDQFGYKCDYLWKKGGLIKYSNIRLGKIASMFSIAIMHPSTIKPISKLVYGTIFHRKEVTHFSSETKHLFDDFKNKNYNIILYSDKELRAQSENYYKMVICSDQLWNSYDYYIDKMYYLRFCPEEKRVSYATSMGSDTLSYWNRRKISKFIREIPFVSVREQSAVDICKREIGVKATLVSDPTLLLDKETWKKKLGIVDNNDEQYCLAYFLKQPSAAALEAIAFFKEKMPVKVIPYSYEDDVIAESAGPREFIELMNNATYVLTDSYHGTLFSINFEKQFITFLKPLQKRNENTRFDNIAQVLDVGNRFVISEEWKDIVDIPVDYSRISMKKKSFIEKSQQYMEEALK